jgi:hypothetical protein
MGGDDREIGKTGQKEQCLVVSHGVKGIGLATFSRGDIAPANPGEM